LTQDRHGPTIGVAVVAAAVLVTLSAHSVCAASVTEIHYAMGTYLAITVQGVAQARAREVMRGCFAEARRLEAVFSRYDPLSELSRLNASIAPASSVSDDMADLVRRSSALRAATDGAFDVSIGGLTALWRTTAQRPPAGVLAREGGQPNRVRLRGRTLTRSAAAVQLDFDGVAKGYAVDRCVTGLRSAGIGRALINFGESSQYALGVPEGEPGWSIAVRGSDPDTIIGTVRLRDEALSASAVFGHERTLGGRRVGHIINPASGEPLESDALALVVASDATTAEAFSKAVLIWGEATSSPRSLSAKLAASRHLRGALYVRADQTTTWRANRIRFSPASRPLRIAEAPLS